jgi:HlyD family secretion protein
MRRKLIGGIVLLTLIGGVSGIWYARASGSRASAFRTEKLSRGELKATIGASGTLEPDFVVDVGAQVVGQIVRFGDDATKKDKSGKPKPIDYGSVVKPGMVLAQIDDKLYKAKVEQSEAQLNSAKAKVKQAEASRTAAEARVASARANVEMSEANLTLALSRADQSDRDWDRARQLANTRALAPADVDAAESAYGTNRASIGVSRASVAQTKAMVLDAEAALEQAKAAVIDAQAAVNTAKAQLDQDKLNLDYCTIRSLIEGVVIDRRVTLGQTVQSSFNTPSLFLIAKDLKEMKVWAAVNEADMSQVHVGQSVTFTVDAIPGEVFNGTVDVIRLNATMTQQVVTYQVEVLCDNSSGRLLPYQTANLKFQVGQRTDALLVSNEALRWRPAVQQVVPSLRKEYARSLRGDTTAKADSTHEGTVWVEENGFVRPIQVQLGLTDGTRTEVLGDSLKEEDRVITGESLGESADGGSNPFAPQMFGGKKQ